MIKTSGTRRVGTWIICIVMITISGFDVNKNPNTPPLLESCFLFCRISISAHVNVIVPYFRAFHRVRCSERTLGYLDKQNRRQQKASENVWITSLALSPAVLHICLPFLFISLPTLFRGADVQTIFLHVNVRVWDRDRQTDRDEDEYDSGEGGENYLWARGSEMQTE